MPSPAPLGSADDVTVACEVVAYAGLQRPEDLVASASLDEVFTERERRQCAARSDLDRWAGRLAAKRAVARVLCGVDGETSLLAFEVLATVAGEPTVVASGPALGVTISHDRGVAVALAWRWVAADAPMDCQGFVGQISARMAVKTSRAT